MPLVCHPELFRETFQPPVLRERENQINELAWCLAPLLKGNSGSHIWLHGPTGSGKTAAVRNVLESFTKKSPVPTAYVNCWDRFTFHGVVDKILYELRVLGVEARSTSLKLERLEQHLKDTALIIVLDEIDRMSPMDREDLLYNLIEAGNTSLICIASSSKPLTKLDPRVRSRFNPTLVEFPPYSSSELNDILAFRSEHGLADESHTPRILKSIATQAEGDARLAIQTLRNAARLAERGQSKAIRAEHVTAAWPESRDIKKLHALATLTEHHRLLHGLVRAKGEVSSGELWDLYLTACTKQGKHPIASRTYNDYMNKLMEFGLVDAEWSIEKGRKRIFKPTAR